MTDKQAIRDRVWDHLEESGVARFPFPPHDRIPNVAGAADAAERAADLPPLRAADAVKANPDAPQLPLRRSLLRRGTTLYVAVPRLRDAACFVELDPDAVDDLEAAPTVSNMDEYGRQVHPDAVPPLDAIVVGSVAVTTDGTRIGKGEGYSDLEYAVLRELGLVDDWTPVVTTVHDSQVLEDPESVAPDTHDVPVDWICTPTRTIEVDADADRSTGIRWESLSAEQVESMPVLQGLRSE